MSNSVQKYIQVNGTLHRNGAEKGIVHKKEKYIGLDPEQCKWNPTHATRLFCLLLEFSRHPHQPLLRSGTLKRDMGHGTVRIGGGERNPEELVEVQVKLPSICTRSPLDPSHSYTGKL